MNTVLRISEDKFYMNDQLIYSELPNCPASYHGLLMNARFIQGIFDDKADASRFNRYGKTFDADLNTQELIDNLPAWYEAGLRAITVGFQGGGPCFTINNQTISNSPFSEDGNSIEDSALDRMEKIILAADKQGMIVIVSYFYGAQSIFLKDDDSVVRAVKTASNWLRDRAFTNVIIEIANEQDLGGFNSHPVIQQGEGMVRLLDLARRESGGMPVGCSLGGGGYSQVIAEASDVILIHGNGQSRQYFYNLIKKAKAVHPIRPIVCNEDSQAISQLEVAFKMGISWGYYNNMTKQEPPADWSITKGEDLFFATRMAMCIGLPCEDIPEEDQYYLQGLHENQIIDNEGWIRLASLYPEKIDYVEFYRNGDLYDCCYDEPFSVNYINTWLYGSAPIKVNDTWKAVVYLTSGKKIECTEKYVGESDEC